MSGEIFKTKFMTERDLVMKLAVWKDFIAEERPDWMSVSEHRRDVAAAKANYEAHSVMLADMKVAALNRRMKRPKAR